MDWGNNIQVSDYFRGICDKLQIDQLRFVEAPADLATVELTKISKEDYPVLFTDSIDSEFLPNQVKDLIENPSVVFSIVDYVELNIKDRYLKVNEAFLSTKMLGRKIIKRIEREFRNQNRISIKKVTFVQMSGQTAQHFGNAIEIQFQLGPIDFNKEDWKDGDIF